MIANPKKIKMKFKDLNVKKIPVKHKNSLMKLIVPGNPILLKIKIKNIVVNTGIIVTRFLRWKTSLIEKRSYKQPKQKNIPAEVNPCATIIKTDPTNPFKLKLKRANKTRCIWTIDEYAIIFLKSNCLRAPIEQ